MAAPRWWECSECGQNVQRPRPPAQCRGCGTAGVIFVPAVEEPTEANRMHMNMNLDLMSTRGEAELS
ncbi:MAG: hypothetical protein JNM17_24170 [Archangium sp.]|nr:hypothetical protein [Archangium sp.]